MKAVRKASDLYQVDFMAALFSGFLLVWLANASDSDQVGRAGPTITPIIVLGLLLAPPTNGQTDNVSYSALPSDAAFMNCVKSKMMDALGVPTQIYSLCSTAEARIVDSSTDQSTWDVLAAENKATKRPSPLRYSSAVAIPIEIIGQTKAGASRLVFIGKAVTEVATEWQEAPPWPPQNCCVNETAYRTVAVGVSTDPNFIPTKINLPNAFADLGIAFDLSESRNAEPAFSSAVPYLEHFDAAWSNPTSLAVLIIVNPGPNQSCFRARLLPVDTSKPFEATTC